MLGLHDQFLGINELKHGRGAPTKTVSQLLTLIPKCSIADTFLESPLLNLTDSPKLCLHSTVPSVSAENSAAAGLHLDVKDGQSDRVGADNAA